MIMIYTLLTIIAILFIIYGNKIYDRGYKQVGMLLILIGLFQLLGQFAAFI
jgi:hypothetical protein